MKKVTLFVVLALLFVMSMGVQAQSTRSYLIIANGNIPNNIAAQVGRAGGTITNQIDAAGLVVAESSNPNFASRISGVMAVVPNLRIQMIHPGERIAVEAGNPPNSGDDDAFFNRQWGHDAVNAPEAWAAGSKGQGALVAVLDGGFSLGHPDIAGQVAGWADMTGQGIEYGPNAGDPNDPADDDPQGIFSHGMHVAGTIAAADNAFGIIGVAPEAQLLLVKVLFNEGSGTFEDVVEGIIYAANFGGVDVINMSLGADIPQGSGVDAAGVAALRVMMNRAINYAYQQGITVIVAAGNDARDLDHDASLTVFPAQMPNAISISATGPEGWGADPTTNLDTLAYYSNFGRSGVDFAAPGGDYELLVTNPALAGSACNVAGTVRLCYVWDFVFSTGSNFGGNNWYYWSVGTSMAAPHASGIAALIVAENGGSMHPAQVKAEMARRSDDLGQPGNDPIYGAGRVSSGY